MNRQSFEKDNKSVQQVVKSSSNIALLNPSAVSTNDEFQQYCDILLNIMMDEVQLTDNFAIDNLNEEDENHQNLHTIREENVVVRQGQTTPRLMSSSDELTSSEDVATVWQEPEPVIRSKSLRSKEFWEHRYSLFDDYRHKVATKTSRVPSVFCYSAYSSMFDKISNIEEESLIFAENKSKVFGCHPCSVQLTYSGAFLPPFMDSALFYLSKFGLTSIGIFRKSGVKSRIVNLKDQIENNPNCVDFASLCVYDVADLIKCWLRDLHPHLISKKTIQSFQSDQDNFSLVSLPDSHRYLLLTLLKFLALIASYSAQNQMTSHNLAICFTPSLCECECESEIVQAQKCLHYCIDHHDVLFNVPFCPALLPVEVTDGNEEDGICDRVSPKIVLNKHTAEAIVCASPQDILKRILYDRSSIDPLISEWSIKDENECSDVYNLSLQFSHFLPLKVVTLERQWKITDDRTSIVLNERANLYESVWLINTVGQGRTQVTHKLNFDLRGFSTRWYQTVFPVLHQAQLDRLASSFHVPGGPNILETRI